MRPSVHCVSLSPCVIPSTPLPVHQRLSHFLIYTFIYFSTLYTFSSSPLPLLCCTSSPPLPSSVFYISFIFFPSSSTLIRPLHLLFLLIFLHVRFYHSPFLCFLSSIPTYISPSPLLPSSSKSYITTHIIFSSTRISVLPLPQNSSPPLLPPCFSSLPTCYISLRHPSSSPSYFLPHCILISTLPSRPPSSTVLPPALSPLRLPHPASYGPITSQVCGSVTST